MTDRPLPSMDSSNQLSIPKTAELDIATSRKRLASLEHETATRLEICKACSRAKFHEVKELEAVTERSSLQSPPVVYFKRLSRDIAGTHRSCWFCRLIHRFCAQLMPDDVFIRWCTENVEVSIFPSEGIWEAQFLGVGIVERSDIAFLIRINGLGHEYDAFRLTCYPRNDLPSREIDRTISTTVEDELYIQKIKHWISICSSSHSICTASRNPTLILKNGLDLINVKTREIVTITTHCRYIALSFVWGDNPFQKRWPNEESENDLGEVVRKARRARLLPTNLPSTIEDAFSLASRLGETYIWIDCFCIEQDDIKLKSLAIKNMDVIYSGAFITICVLDSGSIFKSIPGVGIPHRPRLRATTETEHGWYFATKYEYLSSVLSECSWSSRAWTFQEGALSTRRLCFHQHGVFLICEEELFHDVMRFDESNDRVRSAFDSGRDYGLPFSIDRGASAWDFEVYAKIVTAYTRRKLSYQSDALNAVTGALQMIARNVGMSFRAAIPANDLLNGLLWLHPRPGSMNGPFAKMNELHDIKAHRRPEFPSWSWLGWHAPAKYPYWIEPCDSVPSIGVGGNRSGMYSVNDNGQTLYKCAIRMKLSATASIELASELETKPILVLETQSISLPVTKVAKSDPDRDRNGDHWVISNHSGQPIVIENVENFHNDSLIFFYWDASTMQVKCSVNIHCCISDRLSREGTQNIEFVLLQHWLPTRRNDPEKIHKESWLMPPYDMSYLAERVWVMAIARGKDGFAERLGITWIPGRQWLDAGPKDVKVRVV